LSINLWLLNVDRQWLNVGQDLSQRLIIIIANDTINVIVAIIGDITKRKGGFNEKGGK
jgi:hypothetical protein